MQPKSLWVRQETVEVQEIIQKNKAVVERKEVSRPVAMQNAYVETADTVLNHLQVSAALGLDNADARRRMRRYGSNVISAAPPKSLASVLYDQLKSFIILLLVIAAGLSFLFGQWTEGAAIAAVIIINTAIGFITGLRAVRSMEALRRLSAAIAKVRRIGRIVEIPSKELVPGDIVIFDAGDIISADLRLIEASKLQCDESILTGESMPVLKHTDSLAADAVLPDRLNMAFQGTAVTSGSGEGVVVATAMSTELGRIATMVEYAESETTPLEKRLGHLSHQLVLATLVMAALIGIFGILGGKPPLLMVETAIALAVAAVPEGLPIVATLALARGMWRMARRNALIKRLPAVETLGATTVILTDKTGTLTENKMTVTRLVLSAGEIVATETGFEMNGREPEPETARALKAMLEVGVLCNNASLSPASSDGVQEKIIGDPMEGALLVAGRLAGLDRNFLIQSHPELREEAFDNETKMMATVHRQNGGCLVAVKGAPESVLAASNYIIEQDQEREVSNTDREAWLAKFANLASSGLRILAFAMKTVEDENESPYSNLTFLGLIGLEDPPRHDVGLAVERCKQAGMRVVMVTGDHAVTARQIATAVGIAGDDAPPVCEGKELGTITDLAAEQQERLLHIPIFARVSPRQKLDLISLYQSDGAIVAMTGDGVNDAPALRQADIGIVMGQRGSQVAREAADVVLQDDAFETIVMAVAQGRVIFANIRKFLLYLLSCNLSEILIVGLAALSGMPLPILPLQILYLNLVTDVFPALALGAGEGEINIMASPPRDTKEPLVPPRLWLWIGAYSTVITIATLAAFIAATELLELDPEASVSVAFLTLALSQLWHVFNMRDTGSGFFRNEITKNRYVWGALVLCIGLIAAAIYLPGLSGVLGLTPPPPDGWWLAIGLSALPFVIGQISKMDALSRPLG